MSARELFQQMANKNGVNASYSGKTKTMFVKGDDSKAKSFIRIVNLKGKGHYPFAVKQG